MIAYLSGPIENAHNDGADWRQGITEWLETELNHQDSSEKCLELNQLKIANFILF